MVNIYEWTSRHLEYKSIQTEPNYLPTGFINLDTIIGGLRKGQVIVISSEPGEGKTTFALQILLNIHKYSKNPVAYFTCDSYYKDVAEKILTLIAKKSYDGVKPAEFNAMAAEYDNFISELDSKFFVDYGTRTFEDIARISLDAVHQNAMTICIDSLQHLDIMDKHNMKNNESILHHVVYRLKEVAVQLDVPIILLSNNIHQGAMTFRFYDYNNVTQCGDNGACMEVADVFIKLSRPDLHDITGDDLEEEKIKNKVIVGVRKNRNGRCGSLLLDFDESTGMLNDIIDKDYTNSLMAGLGINGIKVDMPF